MYPKALSVAVGVLLAAATANPALAKPPFPEPEEGPDPRGITLSGSGLARVERPARLREDTIERAVQAARPTAILRAVRRARRRAAALASAAGLTLGDIETVTVNDPERELGFGPRRHCRRVRARPNRRPRLRCRVPPFAAASASVTFATAETSAVVPGDRAVLASGTGRAPVTPERRNSPSIRAALVLAQVAAAPSALAAARRDAATAAQAAGSALGPLFAIAEQRREPFISDVVLFSPFGAGRFCARIRERRVRRDPATGRRRVVRGPPRRRCFFPGFAQVTLRVTFS